MELFIFARFHARESKEGAVEALLREQIPKVRDEPGCISIHAYRTTGDPRLFWIHSRWVDEAAFNVHAELPNTMSFVERMEPLIDHPFDAKRAARFS